MSGCKGKSPLSKRSGARHSRREEDPDNSIRVDHKFFLYEYEWAVMTPPTHYLSHFGLGVAIVGGSLIRDWQNRTTVGDGSPRSPTEG